MKYNKFLVALLSLSLFTFMMMTGCGDDDNPDPLNIVGTWLLSANGYGVISPMTLNITAHRSPTDIDATVTPAAGDPGYITGITVTTGGAPGVETPRNITIVITFNDGLVLTLTGAVNDDNTGMSGTYTDTSGGADSWTAIRQ